MKIKFSLRTKNYLVFADLFRLDELEFHPATGPRDARRVRRIVQQGNQELPQLQGAASLLLITHGHVAPGGHAAGRRGRPLADVVRIPGGHGRALLLITAVLSVPGGGISGIELRAQLRPGRRAATFRGVCLGIPVLLPRQIGLGGNGGEGRLPLGGRGGGAGRAAGRRRRSSRISRHASVLLLLTLLIN